MTVTASLFHRAIYLTGPTACGKTAVGVALAQRLGAEVVALDSMTLYRGMDIGTAKPSALDRQGIPHHLIDVIDPWDSASVADYRRWAAEAVSAIEKRGRRTLFVGGTPLYLKTLLRGLFDGPSSDPGIRRALQDEAERLGDRALHARLAAIDPSTASKLHPNDRRRVVRALEVAAATGQPISRFQSEHAHPVQGVSVFALERPRAEIRDRIDRRVLQMFRSGLIEEVRGLRDGIKPIGSVAAQGVGYREVLDHLLGRLGIEETVIRIQARTRQFAKRQATWFRGLAEVRAWPVGADEAPELTADRLAGEIARAN